MRNRASRSIIERVRLLRSVIVAGLLCLTAAERARAEPYMAIREGRKCSTCHVNMDGGGMRTLLANTHMEEITHYRDIFPKLSEAEDVFNGQIVDFFSIGADLRVTDSIVFQDKPNAEGKVPNNKVFRSRVDENILDVRQASLYFDVKPIPDYLDFYVDLSLAPGGTVAREVFALLKGVIPGRGYAKAGRFFLDYGLRTANDDLFAQGNESQKIFVRGRTGTDFTGYAQGFELGFEPGPFHFTTSVTGGSSDDTDVRVTSNGYAMLRDIPVVDNAMYGASFMYANPPGRETYTYGFYAGSNLGPLEYQAEIDFIHATIENAESQGTFLVYGELNYLLLDWINTKLFGEYADNAGITRPPPATGFAANQAQNRFGFGFEPFIGRFLQTSIFYTIANGPQILPETNQNRIVMELHLFF